MKENWQEMCDGILNGISLEKERFCAQNAADKRPEGQNAGAESEACQFQKPRLLLHACCAPCSSYTLEYLLKYFDITIYYYNPNIHPKEEYARRLQELKNFLPRFLADQNGAQNGTEAKALLQEADYEPQEFFDATGAERDGLQDEPERGERCRRCYQLRMERAYEYARQNGFDWFTTTLSISPHKDARKINEIGRALAEKGLQDKKAADGSAAFSPKFLYSDFKKKNGYKRSLELSKEYGLYRQDYCGCVYSMRS